MGEMRDAKGFFGYQLDLESEIFAFQREEYPLRDPRRIADNWRWMFVDSAKRLGLGPRVWLYRKDSAVVAHQGAIPVRLQVGAEEVITGWFVETMAAERIRGSPIGPMLIRKALEDMPMNLSLGQTQQMRELQFAMGWKYVCSLTKYVFVSGYRMNLRNKLPIVVAESVAAAFGLQHNLRWRRERRVGGSGFRVGPIERFTDEHDELWKRMASTCTCAVVRDSSYMNWKYVDRPYRRFSCIELRKGSSLMGVLVAMVAEPNEVYPYRRGFLVDFVVPLDRRDLVARLVVEGIGALKRCGVQTIVCQSANVVLGAVLERFGFMARSPRHQFLVASGRGSDSMTRYLLEPKNWFLTLGDSDADAYPD